MGATASVERHTRKLLVINPKPRRSSSWLRKKLMFVPPPSLKALEYTRSELKEFLRTMLVHSEDLGPFSAFLASRIDDPRVQFYLEVHQFTEESRSTIKRIYDTYLKDDAPQRISVTPQTLATFEEDIMAGDLGTIFSFAKGEVLFRLAIDNYQQFLENQAHAFIHGNTFSPKSYKRQFARHSADIESLQAPEGDRILLRFDDDALASLTRDITTLMRELLHTRDDDQGCDWEHALERAEAILNATAARKSQSLRRPTSNSADTVPVLRRSSTFAWRFQHPRSSRKASLFGRRASAAVSS